MKKTFDFSPYFAKIISMKRVISLVSQWVEYNRGILRGVAEFGREHKEIQITLCSTIKQKEIEPRINTRKFDGVISCGCPTTLSRLFKKTKTPWVSVITKTQSTAPVYPDHNAIGRLAGQYLLNKGLRSFAFCGDHRKFCRLRFEGYCASLANAGYLVDAFPRPINPHRASESLEILEEIGNWLRQQSHPVGLFCATDTLGQILIEAAHIAGLRVPEQVAVLGVDNGDLTCELTDPPLSSIDVRTKYIGYKAMELLNDWMDGEPPLESPILVEPGAVMERASTDLLAIEDDEVVKGLRFMRENFHKLITIQQVHDHVIAPDRSLDRRFKKLVGRSMKQELLRLRLEHAKKLLRETDMPIERMYRRCGFCSTSHFSYTFHKKCGVRPSEFRKKNKHF